MIKINNLNKYYNKSKSNELRVINDTCLELPKSGLICFVGKSGSGKTTLLNVIGGLDKETNGNISYDNLEFKKYNMHQRDLYRKDNIGYIFQNYLLLDNKSVYDNLKIALELIGVTDDQEQKKRIEFVLRAVGLYKYRKKRADKLSGGQQQRVSIARALLKECKVIIADEPTGNLDSENTIEVMNILKKISEKTLVLLVTHNKEIAEFYSDRIVELADGKIISDSNPSSNDKSLQISNESKIHLLDYSNEKLDTSNYKLNLYSDDASSCVELTLVVKNNTIYIDSDANIKLIKQSNIELVNDHYKHLEKDNLKDFDFDISWYDNSKKQNKFLHFLNGLKTSLFDFVQASKKAKVFHIIFTIIGVIMAFCVIFAVSSSSTDSTFYSTEDVSVLSDEEAYLDYEYYPEADSERLKQAVKNNYIKNVYSYSASYHDFNFVYNSVRSEYCSFRMFTYPYSMVENNHLICGTKPKETKVVIGNLLADKLISGISGINSYEELLNCELSYSYYICGVVKSNTNSCYFEDNFYYSTLLYGEDYDNYTAMHSNIEYKDYANYKIVVGRDIQNENEIVVNYEVANAFKLNTPVNYLDKDYTVVGYFNSADSLLVTKDPRLLGCSIDNGGDLFLQHYLPYNSKKILSLDYKNYEVSKLKSQESRLPENDNEIMCHIYSSYDINDYIFIDDIKYTVVGHFYSSDFYDYDSIFSTTHKNFMNFMVNRFPSGLSFDLDEKNIENIEALGLKVYTPYSYEYSFDMNLTKEEKSVYFIFVVVLLFVSIIYVYFSTRSKLIAEIKDIGVYRSIGATRFQIIKRYLQTIVVETTLTSLLGYLLTTIFYSLVSAKLNSFGTTFYRIDIFEYLVGAVVIYIINIFFGLLPVLLLMRKTPAEINSKYDI